jgi:putative ABC transport system ATP-binding protein
MNNPGSSAVVNDGPLLQVRGLARRFDTAAESLEVLKQVDLEVSAGETVAIIGPSGSGKSTLMFILGLLLPPSEGTYRMGGQDMLTLDRRTQAVFRRQRFGFVFQSCNLIEHTTVWENLEFPLMYAGVARAEREDRIRAALDSVDLAHRIRHPTNLLSGGEQQRVAVARALVNRPQVILADEPTGQLDRAHGRQVMDHFERIVSGGDKALIVVTHDPAIAECCGRVCTLEDGVLNGG